MRALDFHIRTMINWGTDVLELAVAARGRINDGDVNVRNAWAAKCLLDGCSIVLFRAVIFAVGEDDKFGLVLLELLDARGCLHNVADGIPQSGSASAVAGINVVSQRGVQEIPINFRPLEIWENGALIYGKVTIYHC